MTRLGIVVTVAVAAIAWVGYVHLWRDGDVRPLEYRLETLRGFQPPKPQTLVTTIGAEEHVLITAGPRSSAGYSLHVVRGVVQRGRVYIVVREDDKPGRAEITYPYRLLVFPKIDKPVHVHWEGRT
jgi:hypothetical protein